ncbi:condensation domain-containing protein [Streptomyces sp. NPDC050617]|uniref:condensation domain-containing protein n=1 Tax=Streptomyces sp. NPDC050617 TaxID=3154628 RepID=UPI00342BA5C0
MADDTTRDRPQRGRGTGWAAPRDEIPLSAVQEAMWVSWQRDPERWEHIIPLALDVGGDLDTERLRAAVTELTRRHPMLRARVVETRTGTRLSWADAEPVPFTVRTVTEERYDAIVAARAPFDLNRGPLARVEVLHGPDRTLLLFTVHHLVLDGASVPLLLDELRRAYGGERLGEPDALGPYIAHAQRSWDMALGGGGEPLREYWCAVLSGGDAPARPLPVRAEADGYRQLRQPIDPQLSVQVRALARRLGVTYFTVMFAALFVTLHRHTASDDLIASAPYHGRSAPDLDGRVGFFVNVLPFRQRIDGSRTYAELARDLRERVRAGAAHGDLPLPAILRAADLTGPAGRDRTHQVVFQYLQFGHFEEDGSWRGGPDVGRLRFDGGDAPCELRLLELTDVPDYRLTAMLMEDSHGSRMLWKDSDGSLGPELLASLARDHLAVVADMVAAPHRTVGEGLALLPAVSVPPTETGAEAPVRSVRATVTDADRRQETAPDPTAPSQAPSPPAVRGLASPTAVALAMIWQSVLGVPVVSAEDSFFELGGHSLLATTLLTRVGRRFGVDLSIRDLFTHPGFGELAAVIERAAAADAPPAPADAAPARPEPDGAFPASGFQESIWLAQRLDPVHATYHVPLSWEVDGELDPAALRDALAAVIARHEILRTRFLDRDGRLFQEVTPPWIPDVERADLTALAGPEREARLGAWADEAASALVPADGRLLRAALFTVGPRRHVLSLCVHHLVLDGESVPVLVRELERCYAPVDSDAVPPPPRQQYRDLVAAENGGSGAADDVAYWCRQLKGAPSSLGINPPAIAEPLGNLGLDLDPGVAPELLPVQRAEKVSAFMIQATAVAAALHRWTGLTDLTFGIPVAHRGPSAFQDVIGPCLNTLVLRSRCTAGMTLADLLRALREETIDAFEHRAASFEDVVRGLAPRRSPGRTPYADVLLNSVSLSNWSGWLGDARMSPVDFVARRTETSKFPVTITFAERGAALRGSLAYRGDRVGADAAGRLADGITAILNDFRALLPESVFGQGADGPAGRNGAKT